MRIYLAGPMSKIKDFNFPLFDHVTAELRREGHEVCNPADVQRELYGSLEVANAWTEEENLAAVRNLLAYELAWICRYAECIMLLPGWDKSAGAKAEYMLALAIKLKVADVPEAMLPQEIPFYKPHNLIYKIY